MVAELARVHLYDQRGCGRSTAGGPYDIATALADLEALRVHLGHERWVVGGHSWGAALALFYALEHPDRTLGVVYLAGTSIRWDFPERVREARMSRLMADERAELEAGIEDDLRSLRVPILVLYGEHDPDPVGARAVADLAPNGEWTPIPDAGHSPWLEQPAAMRDSLRSFVARVGSGRSHGGQ
jgi:proline iminopeptidase